MKQDRLRRAKERYADAMEAQREQYDRIREDLRFSNPAKPEQWADDAIRLRGSRPRLTFNQCPKFIRQVANDGRGNVPSFQVTPADSFAHEKAAEVINGRLRHIEYVSNAKVAYTTALSLSANCGLGWLRAIPKVVDPETNQQEPVILRVHDPLSCVLDSDSTEPDGSDAEWGFVLSPISRKKFKLMEPKALDTQGWSDEYNLWTYQDTILVAEYFEIERKKSNRIVIRLPGENGQPGDDITMGEDDYWETANTIGFQPQVVNTYMGETKTVIWSKMTGAEELETTKFPCSYIPLVPVIGDEVWVDGKRYLCGLTRQLMDGQRMHNAELSSMVESILSQPKAPFAVSMEAIEGHEAAWKQINTGNPAFLPYNSVDKEGNPIPAPTRLSPPAFPNAYANGATIATSEMQGSVGMYKSSFGEQGNAVSGRAKIADRRESDGGTYHYHDNLARSVEQLGRIVMEMDHRLTDTARSVRTMGEDGKVGLTRYDPDMPAAVKMRGQDVEAVNPKVGSYDMRVKVGPSFLTQNEETASELSEMFQSQPNLLPILGPTWVRMKGIPGAEKIAKLLLSVAPPPVQEIDAEDDKAPQIPQQVKLQMQQMQQQIQQLSQALENAAEEADKTRVEAGKAVTEREKSEADMLTKGYQAVTDRLKVLAPALTGQQAFAIAQMTFGQALQVPPIDPQEAAEPREPAEQAFAPQPHQQPAPQMQPMAQQPQPSFDPSQTGEPQ